MACSLILAWHKRKVKRFMIIANTYMYYINDQCMRNPLIMLTYVFLTNWPTGSVELQENDVIDYLLMNDTSSTTTASSPAQSAQAGSPHTSLPLENSAQAPQAVSKPANGCHKSRDSDYASIEELEERVRSGDDEGNYLLSVLVPLWLWSFFNFHSNTS